MIDIDFFRQLSSGLIAAVLAPVYFLKFLLPKLVSIRIKREEDREVDFLLGTGVQKSDLEKQLWQQCRQMDLFLTPCFIAILVIGTFYVLLKQGWTPEFLAWFAM